MTFQSYTFVSAPDPLFVHQYSHAWIDFRGRRESQAPYIDWFENSVTATRAHKAFCLSLSSEFPGYTDTVWGITASDSQKGYFAWGGPPRNDAIDIIDKSIFAQHAMRGLVKANQRAMHEVAHQQHEWNRQPDLPGGHGKP